MVVLITKHALQTYLALKHQGQFTDEEYREKLRPDAERLKSWPGDEKFDQSRFWGPAEFKGKRIPDAFKMRWRNIGPGRIQLRLGVVRYGETWLLYEGYRKDTRAEKFYMLRLATFRKALKENGRAAFIEEGQL